MEYLSAQGSSSGEGKQLFDLAMKGKWSEVVDICAQNPFVLLAVAITKTGDTLLHLAVSEGKEKTVLEITKIISQSELPMFNSKAIIGHRNDRWNTALHLAALVGNVAMCKCIAEVDPSLIDVARNKEGETPLSLAVRFGRKQAFLCLTQILIQRDPEQFDNSKRMKYGTDGNTVLHHAISGEHYGIFVDEHDVEQHHDDHPIKWNKKFPKNYRACVDFFQLFWKLLSFGINVLRPVLAIRNKVGGRDEERSERQPVDPELGARQILYKILKLASRTMVIVLIALGIPTIRKIYEEKKQHKLSILILNELLESSMDVFSEYYYSWKEPLSLQRSDTATIDPDQICPDDVLDTDEDDNREGGNELEDPILIAARNGISEIVEKVLELIPIAINEVNKENKNVMLLAVQYRQPHVIQILLKKNIMIRDRVLRVADTSGNNAAHLAAVLGEYRPWQIPGEALQMQYEFKWFEFVTESIPSNFLTRRNNDGMTPEEVFVMNHKQLVQDGGKWLIKTSESYSLVAALIATVAFASYTIVPGDIKEDNGIPTLANRTPFHLFAISSLIALCLSVMALVTFLSIVTSRNRERDFGNDLPMKFLIGLTSLFFSIAAVLITFGSGHFFVLDEKLKYRAYPVYAATFLPVTYFAVMQFPLYFDLIDSTFRKVPRRSYKASVLI